ncbi:MAG: alcohol dehydrogenase catalytic domain-containing protein [bacterium]|nr:alcohol dehydrogenase catalytic domain-containing protein [bacterium]
MKAIKLVDLRKLEVLDIPKSKIVNSDDVLIKIKSVGICGSDVHYYKTGRIGSQVVKYPFTLGHECSGMVEDIGSEVKKIKIEDKVAIDPAITCGKCDQCLIGRENTCRSLKFLGCPGQAEGCLSEYILMPEASLCKVPDTMSFEQAVLTEPLCIGSYAVKISKQKTHQNIAILGMGPIGLSVLIFSKLKNPENIFGTDLINERLDVARKLNINYGFNPNKENIIEKIKSICQDGIDIVFECAGEQETLDQAIDILRPGGKLIMIGIPQTETVSFVPDKMRRKELTLINIRRQRRELPEVVEDIAQNRIKLDPFITHRFKPEQAAEAFELVSNYKDGVIKAFISF